MAAVMESISRLTSAHSFLKPWTSATTTIRWRTRKPNIQRPLPDHFIKAKYVAALKPIYPDPLANKPWYEVCGNVLKPKENENEMHPFEKLLAAKALKEISNSQITAILQQNPTKAHELSRIRGFLHGQGQSKFLFSSKKIMNLALSGTSFEPMLQLHVGSTCYLNTRDIPLPKLLKLIKKMPTFVLLGGVVDGRLLTRSQLLWCSTLPDINVLRAELCSILATPSSNISQNLVHHQVSLSRMLDQLADEKHPSESNSE